MLSMHGNSINKFYYHHSWLPCSHIIKHNHKSHMTIVNWHFYEMTAVNKHHPWLRVSQRFESLYTWQYDTCGPRRHHEWPPFAMTIKESSRVLHKREGVECVCEGGGGCLRWCGLDQTRNLPSAASMVLDDVSGAEELGFSVRKEKGARE
jgi:hypothetical protein